MDELLVKRLRAAVAAGWWTLLAGAGLLSVQWLAYLWMMNAKPGWMLALWGRDATWPMVQGISLAALAAVKLGLYLLLLILLWLTFWLRGLRARGGPAGEKRV